MRTAANESSILYTDPISVSGDGTSVTIKAFATKTGMANSLVASAIYVIDYTQVAMPIFNPTAGIYSSPQSLTISTTTSGAFIRYTTDGSTPTSTFGTLYSDQIDVAASVTIKAIAYQSDWKDSAVAVAAYTIISWQTLGGFNYPFGIALDTSGHIYVADHGNGRIVRIDDMSGAGWTTFGSYGSVTGQFKDPTGVAVDASGHIYVADTFNYRIVSMDDMTGAGWTTLGSSGGATGQFIAPLKVAVDSSGYIYVADYGNDRIVRFIMP